MHFKKAFQRIKGLRGSIGSLDPVLGKEPQSKDCRLPSLREEIAEAIFDSKTPVLLLYPYLPTKLAS